MSVSLLFSTVGAVFYACRHGVEGGVTTIWTYVAHDKHPPPVEPDAGFGYVLYHVVVDHLIAVMCFVMTSSALLNASRSSSMFSASMAHRSSMARAI